MKNISEKKLKKYSYFSQGIIAFKLKLAKTDCPYKNENEVKQSDAWNEGYDICINTKKFGDIARHPIYENIYEEE